MDIGIDLGTTNSAVSYVDPVTKEIKLIKNRDGEVLTPSFLYFKKDENRLNVLIGKKAKEMMSVDPDNVVSSYKTYMGTGHPVKRYGFNVVTAEQCSALALKQLVEDAESALQQKVTGVLITVPARFDEPQRQATRDAALLAKIPIIGLADEPTAAAFYNAVNPKKGEAKEIAVVLCVDIGGGTSDIALLQLYYDSGKVLAKGGDVHLGGDDYDRVLADYILEQAGVSNAIQDDEATLDKVIRIAENAKIKSCVFTRTTFDVDISKIIPGAKPVPMNFDIFDKVTSQLTERIAASIRETFAKVDYSYEDLDDIVIVGGSSRNPAIHKMLARESDNKFTEEYFMSYVLDPDLAVCLGAGTLLKYRQEGKTHQLVNIVTNPIGIEESSGAFTVILGAGKSVPISRTQIFANSRDNQEYVDVNIYEGYSTHARSNKFIGSLRIKIPPCLKGNAHIKVTMRMTVDNVLECKAICNDEEAEATFTREYKASSEGIEDCLNAPSPAEKVVSSIKAPTW